MERDPCKGETGCERSSGPIIVFGPAYRDLVVEVDSSLLSGVQRLDQSVPAISRQARADGKLFLAGPAGDAVCVILPPSWQAEASTIQLAEPILARLHGDAAVPMTSLLNARAVRRQLGGMGAGYARALRAMLCLPLGRDDEGAELLSALGEEDIVTAPRYLDDPTDASLVLLSHAGDKLATGMRAAITHWQAAVEDHALAAGARALVFCGAPNSFAAELLDRSPDGPVLYAPAMRNILDCHLPLATLAPRIACLSLNALEWSHLAGRERCREEIPVITVTAGAEGSRIFLRGGTELTVPALPVPTSIDVNRAGETYGAAFFQTLLHDAPGWHRSRMVDLELARQAGMTAARQAARQLTIAGFAFPDDMERE